MMSQTVSPSHSLPAHVAEPRTQPWHCWHCSPEKPPVPAALSGCSVNTYKLQFSSFLCEKPATVWVSINAQAHITCSWLKQSQVSPYTSVDFSKSTCNLSFSPTSNPHLFFPSQPGQKPPLFLHEFEPWHIQEWLTMKCPALNCHKLWLLQGEMASSCARRVRLGIRRDFFPGTGAQHWSRLPRELVEPAPLEGSTKWVKWHFMGWFSGNGHCSKAGLHLRGLCCNSVNL